MTGVRMLDFQRILCPIDFSDASRHALDHAVAFAGWFGSRITGLHVFNPVFLPNPPILFAEGPGGAMPTEADRRYLEDRLREWLAPAAATGRQTDALFDEGSPAARILERATSLPADLIVMGTHGRGGFEHLVLGSVTEKVVRQARCPVLTVPPPAARSTLPFKRVLCPVDFSEASIVALACAFSIAQESDARLTLLHVFDWPSNDELSLEGAFDVPAFRRKREEEARHRLVALIPEGARNWCSPDPTLRFGKPYREILAVAETERADLVVMGVHGRNALDVMLFGSNTNQVVRRASCPVLTLRQ
jgi:nucleotide-binding universal stress UspA family protein